MATFLELCNEVIRIVGVQGTLSSVESPQGIHRNVVEAVRSSWIDMQNLREDWTFMQYNTNLFNTVVDQTTYTPTEVFGSASAAAYLGTYKRKRGLFLNQYSQPTPLAYVPWEDYPLIDNSSRSTIPTWYTVNPASNNLILEKPNAVYNMTIRYMRAPQILTLNTDVPAIPAKYHQAIAYKAVEKVAAYIGQSGLYQEYSLEGNRLIGGMMREYIRPRKMTPRRFV